MAEAWQSAWVEVLPDFKNFKRTADGQMVGVLGAAGTAGGVLAGRNIGAGVLGGIKGLAGPLVAVVAALGIGALVGKAIGSGINYALDSVDLASDLEQSTGAVLAVFKDQAEIIEGFGRNAAKDVGLARTEYQKFAVVVGAQLKNLGIPVARISGQTNDLIKLGADLAAQFGGPTSDAVNALSSLLRGERDPIERYGVGIKQADINARLASQGLKDLTGDAKKQAEIQATLAILWEQTADAQGTFAAEGDTLAGQQQRLQATLADTQTKLGESLLPAFSTLAGFANETLAPALDRMIEKVGPILGEALEEAAPKIEELAEKLTPLVEAFVKSAAEDGIPAFIDMMSDIAEHAPEWVEAFQAIDQAVWDLDEAFRDSQKQLQADRLARIKWFDEVLTEFGNFSADFGQGVINLAASIAIGLARGITEFNNFQMDLGNTLVGIGRTLYISGRVIIQNFINGITSMMRPVGDAVGKVMDFVAGFFPHSPAARGPFSGAGWTQLAKSGSALMDQFSSGIYELDISKAMRPSVSLPSITANVQSSSVAERAGSSAGTQLRLSGDMGGLQKFIRAEILTADGWQALELSNGATY